MTFVVLLVITLLAATQSNSTIESTIAAAVLPLPESLRKDATVVRLNDANQPDVIRKGTNGMVCIAEKPGDQQFDVRCYHESFIPVVYRAFQLGYAVSGPKVGEEIKAGKLKIADRPTAGYRCLGPISAYDSATNTITSDINCWQSIHFPFRTASEIGLPDEADVSEEMHLTMPYVMASGTYWSHVMIRHPQSKK